MMGNRTNVTSVVWLTLGGIAQLARNWLLSLSVGRHLVDGSICQRLLVLVGGIRGGVGAGSFVGFSVVVLSPDQLGRAGCNGINSLHGGGLSLVENVLIG